MTKQNDNRPARQQVNLQRIMTRTDVFQFRHAEVDPHHVDALALVLKNGNPLDRIILWQDPDSEKLVVVDGHHRRAAYIQVGWRGKVPALIYGCSLEQARLLALRENGKTRLPLTSAERMDAAWSLVRENHTAYSKRVIVKATGVADGTVAKMRRTRSALLERDPGAFLPSHWWEALAEERGQKKRHYTDDEREAMIEAKTAQLDEKIGRALGHMAATQIEAACNVIVKRLGRQGMKVLLDEYSEQQDPYGFDDCDDLDPLEQQEQEDDGEPLPF